MHDFLLFPLSFTQGTAVDEEDEEEATTEELADDITLELDEELLTDDDELTELDDAALDDELLRACDEDDADELTTELDDAALELLLEFCANAGIVITNDTKSAVVTAEENACFIRGE